MLFQHGDVLIETVNNVPSDAVIVLPALRGHVLAEGEQTGHAHVIKETDSAVMYSLGNTLFMNVPCGKTAKVIHEEHKPIEIPAGTYKIRQVREYDHLKEESRIIAD